MLISTRTMYFFDQVNVWFNFRSVLYVSFLYKLVNKKFSVIWLKWNYHEICLTMYPERKQTFKKYYDEVFQNIILHNCSILCFISLYWIYVNYSSSACFILPVVRILNYFMNCLSKLPYYFCLRKYSSIIFITSANFVL